MLRKETSVGLAKNSYISKLEISKMDMTRENPRSLWKTNFSDPSLSGTGEGLLQACTSYSDGIGNFYLIMAIHRFIPRGTEIKIIGINVNQNFKITESSFLVNQESKGLGFDLILIPQKVSDDLIRIDVKGKEREDSLAYQFNRQANTLLPIKEEQRMVEKESSKR